MTMTHRLIRSISIYFAPTSNRARVLPFHCLETLYPLFDGRMGIFHSSRLLISGRDERSLVCRRGSSSIQGVVFLLTIPGGGIREVFFGIFEGEIVLVFDL